jgi:general secretion pathway protein G
MIRRVQGFTVIELLVVLAALATLLSVAIPRYTEHQQRAQESVLRHNLKTMREAIDRYQADRGGYPSALAALVQDRYLRELPLDPITSRADTWQVVPPRAPGQGAVFDVRSGAPGVARDGTAYVTW